MRSIIPAGSIPIADAPKPAAYRTRGAGTAADVDDRVGRCELRELGGEAGVGLATPHHRERGDEPVEPGERAMVRVMVGGDVVSGVFHADHLDT